MIAASYQEALTTFRDLCDDVTLSFDNEYVRGGVNLIADLFPVYEMDVSTRMDEVLADLKRIPMFAYAHDLSEFGVVYNYHPID
jgi:hypothetical protein